MSSSVAVIIAACALLVGCSDEQKRDIEGAGVKAVLEEQTQDALQDAGIELDGDLDCSADVADDGTVTGSCSGQDTSGAPIATTLNGTVDVDEASCEADLTITHDAETLVEESGFDCIDG